MQKLIHQSWKQAATKAESVAAPVMLDFSGTFREGSHAGTTFAGRIQFDPTTRPSDPHISFALYEEWTQPVVTMVVAGQVLTASGAAVYHQVFDGRASHYDFVTLYGTGPFDSIEDGAFFELYFANEEQSVLDGTGLPTAQQLAGFPVRHLSFGTNAPGNVLSIGDFTLTEAR